MSIDRSAKPILAAICFVAVAACNVPAHDPETGQQDSADNTVEFAYSGDNGPAFWGALKPDWAACSQNLRQSPIDISEAVLATDLKPLELELRSSPINLSNNGHTIQQTFTAGSRLLWGGAEYALAQFHFHTLSEHSLDGRRHPLEMHAVFSGGNRGFAVIGVFFELGAENSFLARFAADLPEREGDVFESDAEIDLNEGLTDTSGYFNYEGSLTTPPCSPTVNWIVLKKTAQASADQLKAFRRILGNNFRPIQGRNDRVVRQTP